MTGTTHFLVGAAIGKITGNPVLAVVFGFLFHFVMDLVPHWDYGFHFQRKFRHFLVAGSEPFIGLFIWIIVGLLKGFSSEMWFTTFIGGAFCLLPDVMSVFIRLFRIKPLRPLTSFHTRLHWFIPNIHKADFLEFEKRSITKRGIMLGIIYQIPFVLASIYILVK